MTKYEAIAEVYLDHVAQPPPDSSPQAGAWQRLIGAAIILYDVVARQRLIENLPNADDIRAHQEQRLKFDSDPELSPETATDDDNN